MGPLCNCRAISKVMVNRLPFDRGIDRIKYNSCHLSGLSDFQLMYVQLNSLQTYECFFCCILKGNWEQEHAVARLWAHNTALLGLYIPSCFHLTSE